MDERCYIMGNKPGPERSMYHLQEESKSAVLIGAEIKGVVIGDLDC